MLPGEQILVGIRQGCATTALVARREAMYGWRVFRHRKRRSLGPEGKPTGTDESVAVRKMRGIGARRWDGQVRPVRSRGALVVHAWLFSLGLKKFGELTTRAPSAIRKRWAA